MSSPLKGVLNNCLIPPWPTPPSPREPHLRLAGAGHRSAARSALPAAAGGALQLPPAAPLGRPFGLVYLAHLGILSNAHWGAYLARWPARGAAPRPRSLTSAYTGRVADQTPRRCSDAATQSPLRWALVAQRRWSPKYPSPTVEGPRRTGFDKW